LLIPFTAAALALAAGGYGACLKGAEEPQVRSEELARFNRLVVGRELRMVQLKQEGNALGRRLGEPAPYGEPL
jgi:hypothetical protein